MMFILIVNTIILFYIQQASCQVTVQVVEMLLVARNLSYAGDIEIAYLKIKCT